ncbi:uncharacterized protein LOC117589747 [Drosophila guanche]|uniref:Uncharacterized protein n=1 Tax=Drosophila guanche TaxID=7266 RepID=A0A3B0K0Q3_DROGU|nr:uncharacterized protein LOC117589747 [Drosophila guanche]SPP87887.1 Hypothetical predicted protein [Drosophila guanche]
MHANSTSNRALSVLLGLCLCLSLNRASAQLQAAASEDTNPSEQQPRGHSANSVSYFRASIPMRIYECLRESSMLHCTKLYVLQKMEERRHMASSGNLTRDFLDQFFGEETQMGSLISQKYQQMSEKELNQRLVVNFQRFFKHRDLKLHFLSGMLLKIVPSKDNKLRFSLKKAGKSRVGRARRRETEDLELNLMNIPAMGGVGGNSGSVENYEPEAEGDSKQGLLGGGGGGASEDGGGGIGVGGLLRRRKKKHSSNKLTIMQVAVPMLILPVVLLGSLLPFILPALKMATIMSLLMNNGAFMAALLYAARTQFNTHEEQQQHISYS